MRTLAGRDTERTDGDTDTVPPLCAGGIFTTGDDVARGGLKLRCGEMMACRRATLEWRRGSGPSTGGSAGVTVHAVPAPLVDRGFGPPWPWRVGDEVQVPMAAPRATVGPYEMRLLPRYVVRMLVNTYHSHGAVVGVDARARRDGSHTTNVTPTVTPTVASLTQLLIGALDVETTI